MKEVEDINKQKVNQRNSGTKRKDTLFFPVLLFSYRRQGLSSLPTARPPCFRCVDWSRSNFVFGVGRNSCKIEVPNSLVQYAWLLER